MDALVYAAEVSHAQQLLNDVLDKAIENPANDLAAEVGKAQGQAVIAERRLQIIKSKLEAENSITGKQFPHGITAAFGNIQSEIRHRIADGSLTEEQFQPILNELNEHRKTYMTTLEAVFMKIQEVNKDLAHIQHSTASAVRRYAPTDVRFGMMGPVALSESEFEKWAWVSPNAYSDDLGKIRKAVLLAAYPEHVLQPAYSPDKIIHK
jgi:hypothetical protein